MYVHHDIGVYDKNQCCTSICVWFCNVYIVDVLHMSLYVYLIIDTLTYATGIGIIEYYVLYSIRTARILHI